MIRALTVLGAIATAAVAGAQHTEEYVKLGITGGEIHGTVMRPLGATSPMPVALIIAGSGPTDRDGNTPLLPGRNNSLKLIAQTLADHGVASLRYDKRGIGASKVTAGSEADLRFTTFVDDAAAWIDWLRSDGRFSTITLIGHSEGSLIAIMAAQRARVDRLVSLAGAGRSAADVLEEQLRNNAGGQVLEDALRILGEVKSGREVTDVPRQLNALFRPSVQPYLISWLNLDPAAELSRLTIPVLVVQGTTDVQVGCADAERLAGGNALATLEIIEGMNHVLKEVRHAKEQFGSYSDSTLTLHPRLVELLSKLGAR